MSTAPSDFGSNIDDVAGLPNMEPAVVRDAPVREVPKPKYTAPRVRIVLEENDGIPPTGQFIGVDGVGYMLKPGKEADVPKSVVEVLNNAIMSTPVVDPETKQVTGFRDRLRYPYRVIREIPADAA